MPTKYRKKYKKKRKVYKKKAYKKRRRGAISYWKLNQPSALPDQTYVKLKYNDLISRSGTISDNYLFALNGLFDPNITGAGAQPLGYDQWSSFYTHYQVMGSSINITFINNSLNNTGFAVFPSNDPGIIALKTAITQPYSRYKFVANINSQPKTRIKNYMSVKRLEARSTDSVNFAAPITSNPSILKYWHIVSSSMDLISNLDFVMDVQVVYYVKFFRRVQLLTS